MLNQDPLWYKDAVFYELQVRAFYDANPSRFPKPADPKAATTPPTPAPAPNAAADFARYLHGQSTDNMLELRYTDRRRVHNLKYYTWVEQQGRTYQEIQDQWYQPNYWTDVQKQADQIDELIVEFNKEVGLS